MQLLFILGRLVFGGFFIMEGARNHFMNLKGTTEYAASKGVPHARLAVLGSGLMIVIGGLGVVFGIAPRLSLLLIAGFLVPVALKMHPYWKIEDPMQKGMQMINFRKNLALAGAALMMLMIPTPWFASLF